MSNHIKSIQIIKTKKKALQSIYIKLKSSTIIKNNNNKKIMQTQ